MDLPVGSCPNFRSSFDKRPFSRYEFHAFNDRLRFRDDARSSIRCTVVPVNIAIRLPNIRGHGVRTRQCNKPKTATPAVVPTNTLPSATVGVMNLLPVPK